MMVFIDNAGWGSTEDGLYHIGMHAGTGWVGDDDVGTSMLSYELVAQHILHIAGIEKGVVDAVDLGVDLSILNGFRDVLDADDLTGLTGHEVGNGASAGVKVVDKWMVDGGWWMVNGGW